MGSLVDLASQFEVADEYSQINYKNNPVRVTPLRYADLVKWFTNKKRVFLPISKLIWQHSRQNLSA